MTKATIGGMIDVERRAIIISERHLEFILDVGFSNYQCIEVRLRSHVFGEKVRLSTPDATPGKEG